MKKPKQRGYKYCLVPCCKNTTINSPGKLFFNVPRNPTKRKAWIEAMRRVEKKNDKLAKHHQISNNSSHSCCEDHFSLQDDMKNYIQWSLTHNVKRKQLKKGVVPHIFDCQKRKQSSSIEQKGAQKRRHLETIEEAVSSTVAIPSTSCPVKKEMTTDDESSNSTTENNVQVNIKCKRRKKFYRYRSKATNTVTMLNKLNLHKSESEHEQQLSDLCSEFECSSVESCSEDEDYLMKEYKEHLLEGTLISIERNPKLFLGLPPQSFFLIQMLSTYTKLSTMNIYIVLKKLKLNDAFEILAIDFGLHPSAISRIFLKGLPLIAQLLRELIIWPDKNRIRARLPIPFRARYYKVISIIDCLEIKVQKPSNPVHQELTWSTYKSCNTFKYLISYTPDGLITFISEGYRGRTSDVVIVEDSGYCSQLNRGDFIMADREFEQVSSLLEQRGCTLVRPPSVSSNQKSSKGETKETRYNPALCIHVERVIGRVTEFKMLAPHARIDHNLIPYLDEAIIAACGIINMQDPHSISRWA